MSSLNRRAFSQGIIGSTLTFSLLESLFCRNAFSDEIKPLAAAWLAELNTIGNDIKNRKLTQVEWQEQVEKLMAKVNLTELMKFVDFEKLTKNLPLSDRGERAVSKRFPEVEGLPTKLVFGHQIFALKKNRSVAPHGHYNMATAFLVLKGDCHGRHYDRSKASRCTSSVSPVSGHAAPSLTHFVRISISSADILVSGGIS